MAWRFVVHDVGATAATPAPVLTATGGDAEISDISTSDISTSDTSISRGGSSR